MTTRVPEFYHGRSCCLRCRRTLTVVDRKLACPQYEPARCKFCAVPLTVLARKALEPYARGPLSLEEVAG
jgi:hypothetical protein